MESVIRRFRCFNRRYTRVLGLLQSRLLGSPLTLAQARALFEIRARPGIHATELAGLLGMDRGQLSRILARLCAAGYAARQGGPSGRRPVALNATKAGLALLKDLDAQADRQAAHLLAHLDQDAGQRLADLFDELERLLLPSPAPREVLVRPAALGDMAWVASSHATVYAREYGFNEEFEGYVLCGLAEYCKGKDGRSGLWLAETEGRRVGSVGIVAQGEDAAQLRWLLVQPHARGLGAGRRLAEQALAFCRAQGMQRVFLWTLAALLPARALYASLGFTLAEEKPGRMGGREMVEERWELAL